MSENKSNVSRDTRTRNYACVLYPESANPDWLNILSELKIPLFVSPLHDKDINPGGEPKKPHHHILVCFEGKKSVEQVQNIFNSFGGVGCEVVQSVRGYARYLCHLDNPEKYQYNTNDVMQFGSADYITTIGLPIDKYKAIADMIEFCDDNDIYSYAQLLRIAQMSHFDWFRVLCDNGTVVMKEYLKSKSWEISKPHPYHVNQDGEIVTTPDGFSKDDTIEF